MSRPRHLTTFGSLASPLVAIGALVLPAGAAAQTRTVETASAGDVTAELSYVKRTRGSGGIRFEEFRDFRVKVLRGGQVLYDKPIGKPCEQFCTPTESALTRKHVGLRDLNGDGEPAALEVDRRDRTAVRLGHHDGAGELGERLVVWTRGQADDGD